MNITANDDAATQFNSGASSRAHTDLRSTFIFIPESPKIAEKFTFTREIPPLAATHHDVDQGRSKETQ